jgi:DNA-binding response OmpR family regulator
MTEAGAAQMTVLVVDDSARILSMISALMDKDGFRTLQAISGREALSLHASEKPEIVCLDIMLGDMMGWDVCREIRKTDADVSVLMISSKSGDADIAKSMAAGATDYVAKPFDLADLAARAIVIARERIAKFDPRRHAERLDFGPVTIYPGQLRAERGDEGIDLNFRDVNILRLLREKQGQAVPVAALRNYSWAGHPSGADHSVAWNISQLRKKLEADPENPELIRDAEGGYMFP